MTTPRTARTDELWYTYRMAKKLHLILVQYRGSSMANCELVGEKRY